VHFYFSSISGCLCFISSVYEIWDSCICLNDMVSVQCFTDLISAVHLCFLSVSGCFSVFERVCMESNQSVDLLFDAEKTLRCVSLIRVVLDMN